MVKVIFEPGDEVWEETGGVDIWGKVLQAERGKPTTLRLNLMFSRNGKEVCVWSGMTEERMVDNQRYTRLMGLPGGIVV